MIYTSRVGVNAPVFLDILTLYVPKGAIGCDVTYGRGVFWSPEAREHVGHLFATDKMDGVCLSNIPYIGDSLDFHVLDPPYMGGFFRPASHQKGLASHSDFSYRYGHHGGLDYKGLHYHAAVDAIYKDGIREAHRVLRPGGVQITKCMDEISNHRQHLTHCDIVTAAQAVGFETVDLFVVTRNDRPHGRRIKRQEHARKNHSYFLVFKKL